MVSKIAGRLKYYSSAWSNITSDKFICNSIRGFKIPFADKPIRKSNFNECLLNKKDECYMQEAIDNLMEKGAIRKVNLCKDQFLSTYFLVPKSNGKQQFVLKQLNKYIATEHFKMEDVRTAIKLLPHEGYMASLDLKDAYFLIPINKNCRKFLRFSWRRQIYEWSCVPFSLNIAPWLFTKIMKPVTNR